MTKVTDLSSDGDRSTDTAMVRVLGTIMRRGAFEMDEIELIAAVARDTTVEAAERSFARQSMSWLAQQSAMKVPRIWRPNDDARH